MSRLPRQTASNATTPRHPRTGGVHRHLQGPGLPGPWCLPISMSLRCARVPKGRGIVSGL
jgi:hypothetical protein